MPPRRPAIDPASLLPLKADVFHILLTLAEGDAHGYAIIRGSATRPGRRGQLQPGAMYRLLKQLLDRGLVVDVEGPASADERRRYYRITPAGREVARAEARRLDELVRASRQAALLEGPGRGRP
ncbi:MAG: PadR family transcriptional regulator [Vicinamibacterales bacterium]